MITQVKEKTPGLRQALEIEQKIKDAGIKDLKLFFEPDVMPKGMWVMYQVNRQTKRVILPEHYDVDGIQPYRIYILKDENGVPRFPDNRDVENARIIVWNAHKVWKATEGNAEYIEEQIKKRETAKNDAHREKQRERIRAVAPELQRAIRRELG